MRTNAETSLCIGRTPVNDAAEEFRGAARAVGKQSDPGGAGILSAINDAGQRHVDRAGTQVSYNARILQRRLNAPREILLDLLRRRIRKLPHHFPMSGFHHPGERSVHSEIIEGLNEVDVVYLAPVLLETVGQTVKIREKRAIDIDDIEFRRGTSRVQRFKTIVSERAQVDGHDSGLVTNQDGGRSVTHPGF